MTECFKQLALAAQVARRGLSPTELLAFKAGLRAAHAEEALTQGDEKRAVVHFTRLVEYVRQLKRLKRGSR